MPPPPVQEPKAELVGVLCDQCSKAFQAPPGTDVACPKCGHVNLAPSTEEVELALKTRPEPEDNDPPAATANTPVLYEQDFADTVRDTFQIIAVGVCILVFLALVVGGVWLVGSVLFSKSKEPTAEEIRERQFQRNKEDWDYEAAKKAERDADRVRWEWERRTGKSLGK